MKTQKQFLKIEKRKFEKDFNEGSMTYVGSRQGRVPQIQNTFTASPFNVHAISLSLNTKVSVLRERERKNSPKNENP